jgi:transposase
MAKKLVSDELWEVVKPLLPPDPDKTYGGRPRVDDRAALTGIIFVLKSGIPWQMLPGEMGCGSGMACWRRLQEWHEAGVWEELHQVLLDRLGEADQIDWSRASVDSASVTAPRGTSTGPNPTDRGKSGTKHHIQHHLLVDRKDLPLIVLQAGANFNDSVVFEEMIDAVKPIKGASRGRPRKRPEKLHADKAYDTKKCRKSWGAYIGTDNLGSQLLRRLDVDLAADRHLADSRSFSDGVGEPPFRARIDSSRR